MRSKMLGALTALALTATLGIVAAPAHADGGVWDIGCPVVNEPVTSGPYTTNDLSGIRATWAYTSGSEAGTTHDIPDFDYQGYRPASIKPRTGGDAKGSIENVPSGWSVDYCRGTGSSAPDALTMIAPDGTKVVTYIIEKAYPSLDENLLKSITITVNGKLYSAWDPLNQTTYVLCGQHPGGATIQIGNLPKDWSVEIGNLTYAGTPSAFLTFEGKDIDDHVTPVWSRDYDFQCATALDPESGFADVTKSTPHVDDIRWLVKRGITTGFDDHTYRGMGKVVRQDMAAFLYRLAGKPAFTPDWTHNPFSDVNEKTPHAKEIMWLASTGITEGWTEPDGSHTFRGSGEVVRQDMAAFLHRYAIWKGKTGVTGNSSFKDVDESTPHVDDIRWLASNGISTGFEDHTFRGNGVVVRQDMAAFLHRLDGVAD